MTSGYRYIDDDGREQMLDPARSLFEAIQGGTIGANTLVFDPDRSSWVRAGESTALRQSANRTSDAELLSSAERRAETLPNASSPEQQLPGQRPLAARTGQSWPRRLAVGSALVVVALSAYSAKLENPTFASGLGYFIGSTGVFWLFVLLARKMSGTRGRDWAQVIVSLLFAGLAWQSIRENLTVRADLNAVLTTAAYLATGREGAPDASPPTSLNAIVQLGFQRSQRAWAEYGSHVERAGGEEWLTVATLSTVDGRQRLSETVRNLRSAAIALGDSIRILQQDAREQVAALGRGNPRYRSVEASFATGAATTRSKVEEFLAAETALFDLVDEVIAVASIGRPTLDATGDRLIFPDNKQAAHFNRLASGMPIAAAREQAAIDALLQHEADIVRGADSVQRLLR